VPDAGLIEPDLGVGSDRRFPFAAVDAVAVEPIGLSVAEGAEVEAVAVADAAGFFDQRGEPRLAEPAHFSRNAFCWFLSDGIFPMFFPIG
jgi:hypothetical protein